jgi:hypothetical protein
MKRIAILALCMLTLALLPACSTSSDDNGSGGGEGLTGTWSGGGTYTQVSDGSGTNQNFTLTLALTESGGGISGTFSYVRTSVGLFKSGTVAGMASGSSVNLSFSDSALSMTGSYSGNTMSVTMTEAFTSGAVAWIRGSGSLSR